MSEGLKLKWNISIESVEDKVTNGLLYATFDDFHFSVMEEKKKECAQDLIFTVTDHSDKIYEVIDIDANEEKTIIHAKTPESKNTFILPTREAFYSLLFGHEE